MKVILRKPVPGLGDPGHVATVKDGYARNFLIPQGLAQPATGQSLKRLSGLKSFKEKKLEHQAREAAKLKDRIEAVTVTVAKQVGEADRLFGTVTAMELSEALAAQGIEVDKRLISVEDPIKSLGSYTVTVKLHAQVHAALKVEVVGA